VESRRDLGGEATGELAFGEEVLEGDTTMGEEARSSGEDTREDSEAESGERSLGDGEDMTVSARDRVRRWKEGEWGQRRQETFFVE
jgi:hypothetical protein